MADGTPHQRPLFPTRALTSALRAGEIVVDLFCGGGGASEALRDALGRDPDIAINHDEWAIGMHSANHPFARHLHEDVWHADPRREVNGRLIGWMHASPDCTHFSQAKGGQPRSRATRSLSWIVLKWAGTVRPRIISLENVEQILKWGPLIAKRDKATGRVVRLDGSIAAPGERVPIDQQFLIPDKRHAGRTWQHFVAALRTLGYAVEWRKLRACDYGAGTSRTRLFLMARRDGEPIQWPAPTHGPGLTPFVTAADCIDWSIPCPSIFTRKKPLADATLRRIAKGVQRYIIEAQYPYIVGELHGRDQRRGPARQSRYGGQGTELDIHQQSRRSGQGSGTGVLSTQKQRRRAECDRGRPLGVPGDGQHLPSGVAAHFLTEFANASRGATWSAAEPLRTQCAQVKGGHFALVTAFLEQANGGGPNGNPARARGCDEPVSAITGTGSQQRVVTAQLEPPTLSPEHEASALRVAAFLVNYYGNGQALDLRDPTDTITTRDRLALVTVVISGTPYVIVDIGLRMLRPAELYRAQGFPADYIIDRTADGRPITGTKAVRMVGNSVSPPPLRAIALANLDRAEQRIAA